MDENIVWMVKILESAIFTTPEGLGALRRTLHDQIDQMVSRGDVHILHDTDRNNARDVLNLIDVELCGTRTRVVRVTGPSQRKLGLADLIIQIAGRSQSPAVGGQLGGAHAQDLLDADVEGGHRILTELDQTCDRILLMIDGAQDLEPTALRYIQQVCQHTPHLRIIFAGPEGVATLLDVPQFSALRRRPATMLYLDGHLVPADRCLASALLPIFKTCDLTPGATHPDVDVDVDVDVAALPSLSSPPLPVPSLRAVPVVASPQSWEVQWSGWRSLAALGLISLTTLGGVGSWMLWETRVKRTEWRGAQPSQGPQARKLESMAPSVPPAAPPDNSGGTPAANPPDVQPDTHVQNLAAPAVPEASVPTAALQAYPAFAGASTPTPQPSSEPGASGEPNAVGTMLAEPGHPGSQVGLVDSSESGTQLESTIAPNAGQSPVHFGDSDQLTPTMDEFSAPGPGATHITPEFVQPEAAGAPSTTDNHVSQSTLKQELGHAPAEPPATPDSAAKDETYADPSPDPNQSPGPALVDTGAVSLQSAAPPKILEGLALMLVRRGDLMFEQGDVSAARLMYERAASAGSGPAATAMGKTFDKEFLARIGVVGTIPDPTQALAWYRRALTLGDGAALTLLQSLQRDTTPPRPTR